MSYDLRDIEKVPIVAVAKKLGMKFGFRGENIRAECPFQSHHDSGKESLSLVFDQPSNTFHCLSCHFRGSVLELVCYVGQVGPSEAIKWIGENFYLPGVSSKKNKAILHTEERKAEGTAGMPGSAPILEQLYGDFLDILSGPSTHAIEYMQSRGISTETLEKHGVTDVKGCHGTSSLLKEKYTAELLVRAGLFDGAGKLQFGEYPLILPYFRDGKPAFIQAHCMDSTKTPRYLRPRETIPFLYNGDALRRLSDGDRVFVVEGIIDCLTLQERGYEAVAAPNLGNFKPEWVRCFKGLETYLVHNGEEAAERAASAIAVLFAKSDLAVHSIRLPGSHDVNSFFVDGGTQLDFEHLVWTAPKIKTTRPILEGQTREAMAEFLEQLRNRRRRTETIKRPSLGLDTGFRALTQVCEGLDPLGSGQTWVVTGRPGVGKTAFCLQMAWQVLKNNEVAVLYVSYNEGKFLLRLKTLCQLSKMEASSVLRGAVQADRLASAIEEMSKWGKGFFLVEGNNGTTIDVIRDYCQRAKSLTGEPRVLVVVDHLEAVPYAEGGVQGDAKIQACASELHSLSRELSMPVVAVSATAIHQACSARPDLNGHAGIEYSEDVMLLLEPQASVSKEGPRQNDGLQVRVRVAKNRHGGVGWVPFDFVPACHFFREEEKTLSLPETETELHAKGEGESGDACVPERGGVDSSIKPSSA